MAIGFNDKKKLTVSFLRSDENHGEISVLNTVFPILAQHNSSIKPSRIKYLFIKDIIALIPVISFAVIDIITPDKPHLIIRYAVCIFIYILILATYHWVINIFKIIPYVKYRDLLKIIDAEIEEAPMTFEK